jgi:hypothetical protein
MKRKQNGKNDAAGIYAQMTKGVHATEQGFDGEDSELTSRNDGSTNQNSKKLQQWRVSAWERRLSELADYRKIHGHCKCSLQLQQKHPVGCVGRNAETAI